ncbi:ResB family protein [Thermincola ferriacetica]|uniref:ResB family protein n=1 Tax=Thermincola ferriacetica TaxID=281456 RepID=A0A0L6W6L9_9FIRM|nr:cytochrome c biogenesis protein ResB [Thermincola ferriacetica]KNZ71013.1 ResB family protein [Thermincola ferriacetica]
MGKKKQNAEPTEEELIPKDEGGGIVNAVWRFFSSMKLGIFLLIIIAVVSIVGTLMRPDPNTGEYMYYRTVWFRFLLFMLTMNLFICSVARFKGLLKAMEPPKTDFNEGFVKKLKYAATAKIKSTASGAENTLENALKGHGYRVNSKRVDEKVFIAADKGRFGVWGSFISHIAFIVIVIGAIIGNLYGFNGFINALEGETFNLGDVQGIKNVDPSDYFDVRVDDFRVEMRPNGMPKDYFSDLTVIDNGEEVLKKTIEVNDPLKYKGIVFYQSSYGQVTDISGTFKTKSGETQEISTYEGGVVALPGTGLSLKVAKFIPDYDPQYGTESKSPNPNNPAVVYAVTQGQQTIAMDVAKLNTPVEVAGGTLEFTKFAAREYTGLQVKKDPGVPVVWLGCGLLVFGVTLSFVIQHRKIWAVISDEAGKAIVDIGGMTLKNKLAFEREFNRIVETIKENK